ncbi:MAG: EAL domain-containing protein [Magnetococcus sp. WYHC-3]
MNPIFAPPSASRRWHHRFSPTVTALLLFLFLALLAGWGGYHGLSGLLIGAAQRQVESETARQEQVQRLALDHVVRTLEGSVTLLAARGALQRHLEVASPAGTADALPAPRREGAEYDLLVLGDPAGTVLAQADFRAVPTAGAVPHMPERWLSRLDGPAFSAEWVGRPTLLVLRSVTDAQGERIALLMGGVVLDAPFLNAMVPSLSGSAQMLALAAGQPQRLVASSRPDQVPRGTARKGLESGFRVQSLGWLGDAADPKPLELLSLIPLQDHAQAVTDAVEQAPGVPAWLLLLPCLLALPATWLVWRRERALRMLLLHGSTGLDGMASLQREPDPLPALHQVVARLQRDMLRLRESERRHDEERQERNLRSGDALASELTGKLRLTEKFYELAGEGMLIVQQDMTVVAANPAFERLTGHAVSAIVGHRITVLSPAQHDAAAVQRIWDSVFAQGVWNGEVWVSRQDGETFPARISIVADRPGGGLDDAKYVILIQDLSELRHREEALLFRTYHDALTGLPNRNLFMDRLSQAASHGARSGETFVVLILDLDGFKAINESHGEGAGDQVLADLSRRFRESTRREDTVSRIDGDTFAFILRQVASSDRAVWVVRKLMDVVAEPASPDVEHPVLSACVGVALFPSDAHEPDQLLKSAQLALGRAKSAGRGEYRFYTSSMGESASQRLSMERELRLALERGELMLHYQPKVHLASNRVRSMEALVRWVHPVKGLISPGLFIPVAEETGLIEPLGEWVLREACRQNRQWSQQGLGALRVAVNLSARQFARPGLSAQIQQILAETGLPASLLEVEITESLVMDDVDRAVATLTDMRDMGLHIAIDDFGTGYSSLNQLKRFPIHSLKIDQSFVRDLTELSEDAAIVRAIISLASSLNLSVVAEGVETAEQLAFLRSLSCSEIQGFLFSRPLPPEAFALLVASGKTL